MTQPASHFIVDMWISGMLSQIISKKRNAIECSEYSLAEVDQSLLNNTSFEVALCAIGPPLWNSSIDNYYQTNDILPIDSINTSVPALTKRRANLVTNMGRASANVLYQELTKSGVNAHRLVDPYDFGEQFGPAEHFIQPYSIHVHPQVGFLCDIHGHLSDAEVIGLLAGKWDKETKTLYIQAPFPCAATERHFDRGDTDVELDSEAEWKVRQAIAELELEVVGWYHSHPKFRPDPSVMDILNQQQYQCYTTKEEDGSEKPFVGLIVSTYDPRLPNPEAAVHKWFTVVPFAPGGVGDRSAHSIDQDNDGLDNPVCDTMRSVQGTVESVRDVIYMPVRMEVQYCSINLAALSPSGSEESTAPPAALYSGFIDRDSAEAKDFLTLLLDLETKSSTPPPPQQPEPAVPPPAEGSEHMIAVKSAENVPTVSRALKNNSSSVSAGIALMEVVDANTAIEIQPIPLVVVPAQSALTECAESTGQVDDFYLAACASDVPSVAATTTSSSSCPTPLRRFPLADSTAEGVMKLEPMELCEVEFLGNGSEKRTAQVAEIKCSLIEGPRPPSPAKPCTVQASIPTVSTTNLVQQEAEQTQIATLPTLEICNGRRPSRVIKSREIFGEFVDTTTSLGPLRKQNMNKVKALEAKEKEEKKQARAASLAEKEKIEIAARTQQDGRSTEAPNTIKRRKKCISCPPSIVMMGDAGEDEALCAPSSHDGDGSRNKAITKKRSMASIKSEVSNISGTESVKDNGSSIFTSVLLALQDQERASSCMARELLSAALPQYRGLVLVLVSIGMYYARSPRRVDLNKAWRSTTRLEKLQASAAVWGEKLGLKPGAAPTENIKQSSNNSGEAVPPQKGAQQSYYLIDVLGRFLVACWEDYARRKRKNASS